MAKVGRPRIAWTDELEDAICSAISVTPKGLEHICRKNPGFPCADEIYERRNASSTFAEKYLRAKASQCMVLADQIIDIADDNSHDVIDTDDGQEINREVFERTKIRIDARKWLAGKLAPKIFGDKLEHTGELGIRTVIVPQPIKDATPRPAAAPAFDEE